MRESQATTLLFLALALVLFFFSLSLLPAVELYCRFRRPAIVLLILELVLLAVAYRFPRERSNRPLAVASFVFTMLAIAFNVVLLVNVGGRC